MPDKRIEEIEKQNPTSKPNVLSKPNVNGDHTHADMLNQDTMSNSVKKQDIQQTKQVNAQTAYTVMNRNGMINSVDPANQNLQLGGNAGSAPVIQSGIPGAPAQSPGSSHQKRSTQKG